MSDQSTQIAALRLEIAELRARVRDLEALVSPPKNVIPLVLPSNATATDAPEWMNPAQTIPGAGRFP